MSAELLSSFFAGILASATPCVYPLIPVTIAVLGNTSARSRLQAFTLAGLYVLGLAVTYTTLGMVSALGGAVFGSALGSPWVVAPLAALFVVLALSSLDLLQIPFMGRLQSWAARLGGAGLRGAFIMGLVSGVVAAPCVGPVVAGILALAAKTGDPIKGGILLFTFSLGLGLPFLILGTFSTLLKKLPRGGRWLKAVKFIIATGLLYVVLTLVAPFITFARYLSATSALSIAGVSLALLAWGARRSSGLVTGLAAFALSFPLYLLLQGGADLRGGSSAEVSSAAASVEWLHTLEAGMSRAQQLQKPIMVDLFAEWCAACKELRRYTFPAPEVIAEFSNFVLVEIDFTEESEVYDRITTQYSIVGLPTILFLTPNGEELPNTRVTGFLGPADFAAHLRKVSSR